MSDLIDRQAAIRIASGYCHPANIAEELERLPSAQPDVPDICVGDMISRQAAIDAVSSMFAPTPTQKDMVENCLEIIENLPSEKPDQEKPAKWIIYEVANCDGEPPIAWECPECGEVVNCKYKFCPECGKPMDV